MSDVFDTQDLGTTMLINSNDARHRLTPKRLNGMSYGIERFADKSAVGQNSRNQEF